MVDQTCFLFAKKALTAAQSTTFESMAFAFRKERELGEDKELVLIFDGEPLPFNDSVKDSELENNDCIEVLVK